jgi:hypothetical protein
MVTKIAPSGACITELVDSMLVAAVVWGCWASVEGQNRIATTKTVIKDPKNKIC